MVFCYLKRLTTINNISYVILTIRTLTICISKRNIKRITKILISEPLITNKSIGSKRKRNRIFYTLSNSRRSTNTNRNTKIICNSTNIPSAILWRISNRNTIFCLWNPCRLSIFSHELFPMFPNNSVWNEEKISIHIHIIHNRSQKSLQPNYSRSSNLKCIPG